MAERGHRPYHARQVYRWIFERRAEGFEGMSDVPKRLRDELRDALVDLLDDGCDASRRPRRDR